MGFDPLQHDVLNRIFIGIVVEGIVFLSCSIITILLLFRFIKSKKQQLGSMVSFFLLYTLSIAASIFGKILTFTKGDYSLDSTEWGIFTNWSFSLALIAFSLFYQLEVAWQLFPPKAKYHRLYAGLGSSILVLIIFSIPRYGINGNEIDIYPIRFILVFIYVLAASLYYMIHSYKIYTFIRNKFLRRRILSGLIFHSSIIFIFIFFMISSIYGQITEGAYYTWGYFIAVTFMLSAAVSGYFYVKQGKEVDRQDIDEELRKLIHDKSNANYN
jgi:hypothetical protein